MSKDIDLFGEIIETDPLLRDKFIEPPFSVLDTKGGAWQNRRRQWQALGIKSEMGRGENLTFDETFANKDVYRDKKKIEGGKGYGQCMTFGINDADAVDKYGRKPMNATSIFDPALCEVCYHWFCPKGGKILDFFAGGSVRGVVAQYMNFKYTGLELRDIQVKSNIEQCAQILKPDNQPIYFTGDSDKSLDELTGEKYDMLFTCPPYVDLEVYSNLPEDLSTMDYKEFLVKYESIIKKSLALLKKDCYAVIVVGEVRDKKGFYLDFVGDTKRIFMRNGAGFYNDAVLLNSFGTATLRTRQFDSGQKLVKVHQNVLVFKKL